MATLEGLRLVVFNRVSSAKSEREALLFKGMSLMYAE